MARPRAGCLNACRVFCCIPIAVLTLAVAFAANASSTDFPGLTYTNVHVADPLLSIHVVQLDLSSSRYEIQSVHAQGGALGLDTLSDQIRRTTSSTAVAAINGDFYQRDKMYAGAPRGLQVMDGELLSGPSGGACFWLDAIGKPHAENIESKFEITLPDGSSAEFGLNGDRPASGVELYTQAIGSSTHSIGGREIVLTQSEGGPWLPLLIGRTCAARIQEIREQGNSPVAAGTVVFSLGPAFSGLKNGQLQVGDVVHISTASQPPLHGIRSAIGGGPMLLRNGSRVRLNLPDSQSYQVTTMLEEHPRAAVGWNEKSLFLVEVDGRQKRLSVGMTLDDLAKFLLKLGCTDAMNFDGGGSATLWFDGEVRNSPCDRMEREIANGLVIVRKKP